jgi:glycosyltransferase involved in cell wall biosynthesis
MRICLISERMRPPYDEGIKNYAHQLAEALAAQHALCALTAFVPESPAEESVPIRQVRTNKLFLSLDLARTLRGFRPDLVLYIPTACATLFSFLRAHALKQYARGASVVMVALQWRHYGALARLAMPHLRPDLVLVQSERTRASLEFSGARIALLPAVIDLERLVPADTARKLALRERYGLDQDAFVILHVGHLNRGRNVQALLGLQHDPRLPGLQTLVVGSSSTEHDLSLISELERGGVRVIDGYVKDIAEVYALADCYLFPVSAKMSAIDLPLSVLGVIEDELDLKRASVAESARRARGENATSAICSARADSEAKVP